MKNTGRFLFGVALVTAGWLLAAGCQPGPCAAAPSSVTTPTELGAAQAQASELGRPLLVLVAESGQSKADDDARAVLESRPVREANGTALAALLDLSVSRTRATAARFHPLATPLLVCLSPRGVILSRDQAPITKSLILERMRQAAEQSPALDAKLARLQEAADKNKSDTAAQLELADFLVGQGNSLEAVPILEGVAHSETAETTPRIRAWEELALAHFWVGEMEKGRHEVDHLMATLGPRAPEARAAGNFALGANDAGNPKRAARARREFEAAIAAAPDSTWAMQAAEALANLPKSGS